MSSDSRTLQSLYGILNIFQDSAFVTDEKGMIIFMNPVGSNFVQSSPQRVLGKKTIPQVIQIDPPLTWPLTVEELARPDEHLLHERKFESHGGQSGFINISRTALSGFDENLYLIIFRDVSAEVSLHNKYKKTMEDLNKTLQQNIEHQVRLQVSNTELDSKVFELSCLNDYSKKTQLTSDRNSLLNEFMEFTISRFNLSGGFIIGENKGKNQFEIQFLKTPSKSRISFATEPLVSDLLKRLNFNELNEVVGLISNGDIGARDLLNKLIPDQESTLVYTKIKTGGTSVVALFALPRGQKKPAERELSLIKNICHQTEVMLENTELKQLAITDEMTTLYNHRYFKISLMRELQKGQETSSPLSLLLLDIDHFKKVNDTYGHPVGDLVLKQVAGKIGELSRITDQAFRYGGEEFAVLLPGTTIDQATMVAERIRKRIEGLVVTHDQLSLKATVSVGVACYPQNVKVSTDIVNSADLALYSAKHSGRNNVQVYSEDMLKKKSA